MKTSHRILLKKAVNILDQFVNKYQTPRVIGQQDMLAEIRIPLRNLLRVYAHNHEKRYLQKAEKIGYWLLANQGRNIGEEDSPWLWQSAGDQKYQGTFHAVMSLLELARYSSKIIFFEPCKRAIDGLVQLEQNLATDGSILSSSELSLAAMIAFYLQTNEEKIYKRIINGIDRICKKDFSEVDLGALLIYGQNLSNSLLCLQVNEDTSIADKRECCELLVQSILHYRSSTGNFFSSDQLKPFLPMIVNVLFRTARATGTTSFARIAEQEIKALENSSGQYLGTDKRITLINLSSLGLSLHLVDKNVETKAENWAKDLIQTNPAWVVLDSILGLIEASNMSEQYQLLLSIPKRRSFPTGTRLKYLILLRSLMTNPDAKGFRSATTEFKDWIAQYSKT